jgi:hypothetical protein
LGRSPGRRRRVTTNEHTAHPTDGAEVDRRHRFLSAVLLRAVFLGLGGGGVCG